MSATTLANPVAVKQQELQPPHLVRDANDANIDNQAATTQTGGGVRRGWAKVVHYGVMILIFVVLLVMVIVLWAVSSFSTVQITLTVLIAFVAILYICQIVIGVGSYSGAAVVVNPEISVRTE